MSSTRPNTHCRGASILLVLLICATWAAVAPAQEKYRHYRPAVAPAFDCSEAGSPVQDFICASDGLSALDREATDLFHSQLRSADLFGRDQLLAAQRRWLTSRAGRCNVPAARQTAYRLDATVTACLDSDYREHMTALRQWQPAVRVMKPDSDHPLSAYIQFTAAESLDAPLCERFREQMNAAIKREGEVNVARIPGARLIAGTHGASAAQQPLSVALSQHDAGPYGSYELRATGLKVGAGMVIDERNLGRWIGEQPNFGGRPSDLSSQTNDYGALDVFTLGGATYALVSEAWGYYTPAASGESSYAGLYSLDGGGAQRRCLYKIYLRPPVRSAFDGLPAYTSLLDTLETIRATEPSGLDVTDRRDEDLLRREQEWQMLNLPLMQTIQAKQFGWSGWLRRRHDVTLDRLFLWSEGSLGAKQLYRSLMATLKPAVVELVQTLQQTQGLTADEATQAAELLVMELMDHALGPVVDNSEAYGQTPASLAKYKPRFPVLPERADLEKGRPVATLYGTVLNRLPAKAVADFIAWEGSHPEKRSLGRYGEPPLAAAVLMPEHVAQLLEAGASPDEGDRFGFTPLMLAARYGQKESMTKLLEAGASLEATTLDRATDINEALEVRQARIGGKTALYFAALGGDAGTVQLLLDRGAKADHWDNYGALPCDAMKLNRKLADGERAELRSRLCKAPERYVAPKRSASAQAAVESFTIERPIVQVGDRWKYESRDKNSGALKRSEEAIVTAVAGERIKVTVNGVPGVMTADLTSLDGPVLRSEPGYQFLSFPLYAGKKWGFRTNWEHKEKRATGRAQMEVTIKGLESVKLASGEVDALRLEAQGTVNVESPIHFGRKVSATYWYAPSMKAIVKTEWIDGIEDMVIEVVSYTRGTP